MKAILANVAKLAATFEQLKASNTKLLEAATDAPLIRQCRIVAENALICPLGTKFSAISMQLTLTLEAGLLGCYLDRLLAVPSHLLSSLLALKQ